MKKIILSIVTLIFLTGCGIYNLNFFVMPDDLEFLAMVEELNTPQKIGNYMLNNFEYETHVLWTPDPYTLWKTKKGDCNDMASYGQFIANYHNYETFTIHIFCGNLYNHYVAVYIEDIWYSITDCQYYYFGFYDFEEIVEHSCYIINKDWIKYIVYDYWNNIVEEVYNN